VQQLVEQYQDVSEELSFYRTELLDIAEFDDQGSDVWQTYRKEMKLLGKKKMRLASKLRKNGVSL
jgi:hypothetical protein